MKEYVAALVLISIAVTGCHKRDERVISESRSPQPEPLASGSRLGRDVVPESVWPPPGDVQRISDVVVSKVVQPGTGKHSPRRHQYHVLGIAYATYDKKGHVEKHVPLMVQAVDLAPATWLGVLLQMKKGEIRRAWINMPDGSTAIMDFELRSFSVIRPDGTAVDIDASP